MADKIKELTPEQWKNVHTWREEWRKIGVNTKPMDRSKVRPIVDALYSVSKHKPPQHVVCVDSPIEASFVKATYEEWRKTHDVTDTFTVPPVPDNVHKHYKYEPMYFLGAWDSYWLSFCDSVRKLGVQYEEEPLKKLDAYIDYAKNCGVAYFYEEIAIVCDNPAELHFDEANRLHAENGPAIRWRDNYAIFSWHGYNIMNDKTWVITDKSRLNPDVIEAESNAEMRRVMLEIFGFEKFLDQREAKVLDEDVNHGFPRRLLSMNVAGETIKIMDVWNGSLEPDGSRRRFFIGALSNANTIKEAVALSYGIAADTYDEGVRT